MADAFLVLEAFRYSNKYVEASLYLSKLHVTGILAFVHVKWMSQAIMNLLRIRCHKKKK